MNRQLTMLTAAALLAASCAAQANDVAPYPAKPVKLIVPAAPGTPPDTVARIVGERLAQTLGQPIVVENRVGAIGTIGLNAVARSAPDGYTLGLIAVPYLVAISLLPQVPYDTEKDLAPVSMVARSYNVLAVSAASPARSAKDLIELARAKPGELKCSSAGNGTPPHLICALINRNAGVNIAHIPYKGSPAAVTALLAGEVDMYIGSVKALEPHAKSGKLRLLATSGPRRLEAFPDLPTLVESGYAGVEMTDWIGVVAPAQTPREITARLHSEILRMLAAPEATQRLEAVGMSPAGIGPDAFAAHIHEELSRWSKLVREAGIRAD